MRWTISVDGRYAQDSIFDLRSNEIVSAIRADNDTCAAFLDVSTNRAALIVHNDALGADGGGSANLIVVRGAPPTFLDHPTYECVANDRGPLTELQDHSMSDTTVAFDTSDSIVYRSADGGRWVKTQGSSVTGLLLKIVANDDAYASTSAFGFIRAYSVLPDGTPVLYRAKTDRDVTALATDGTTMFWVESPRPISTPHEIWAAPYTNDGAMLDAGARQIAMVSLGPRPLYGVAVNGLYAFAIGVTQNAVVRLSDGAVRRLGSSNPRVMFGWPLYVSPTELWTVVATDGNGGAMYVRRYDLGNW